MVGGGTRTAQDIPPFCMAAREPVAFCGLNLVGLRRRGFSREQIDNIHNAYRILYQRGKLREECLEQIETEVPMSPEIEYILEFVRTSTRGIIKESV
ncbi:acyl-[acyl-carrier-protein]-UDP-N-acetylglucosamine O-acyltransferase [gut metagenome]|uniref:Acyl-[acyl-carrier-protein]-UDP-N-acetylglucosamine O-acyltransferase n=1 Tax=gut metagenome TaxID=749906 RepID=J9G1J9_9ZZZZ